MYFDFDDGHPDYPRLPRALSTREEVLVAIIVHLLVIITILVGPRLPFVKARLQAAEQARLAAIAEQQRLRKQQEPFMFVQPRVDIRALRPPPKAPPSDIDRQARARERPPNPLNHQPFSRGNTPEFTEATPPSRQERAAGQPTPPVPQASSTAQQRPTANPGAADTDTLRLPESQSAPAYTRDGTNGSPARSGALGEALRNLQRYADRAAAFENPQGGAEGPYPSIQFDTKGVEFGPWIRRFIAQIKRNWFVPQAAMSLHGHTVITFNVHKDGSLTDVSVLAPSDVNAFNHAAYNALAASNPTQPLPPEYPSEKAFFTVTFYYNEAPPMSSP
jgi:TonB family protein